MANEQTARKKPGRKPGKPKKKPEKGAKKRATQQRIIDAFETVLLEGGMDALGINAIMREAGIGKGLIYMYFGGLEGLADAWMKRADIAPTVEDIAGEELESFQHQPVREKIAAINRNYARMLRDHPAACRILSEDLRIGDPLPKAMENVRLKLGKPHEELVMSDADLHSEDAMARIFILQAAANYLALRANSSPNFNGVPLDTEEGWEMVMKMMDVVAGPEDPSGD